MGVMWLCLVHSMMHGCACLSSGMTCAHVQPTSVESCVVPRTPEPLKAKAETWATMCKV